MANVIGTLGKSVREYKKPSILAPVFIIGEVLLECLIPLVMASMINSMSGGDINIIIRDGVVLVVMAMLSLLCGSLSAKYAATASTGLGKNLRQDLYEKISDFSFC